MPVIVNGLLLKGKSVLLAHRSAERRAYPGTWSFPGGHVEAGETLGQALERELGEEIGVSPSSYRYLTCLHDVPANGGEPNAFHLFVVDSWTCEPVLLGNEHSELRWVDLAEAAVLPNLALSSYVAVFAALDEISR